MPRTGASGVACRLRFSWPALDGNVGNIAVGLGLGSSRKYGCSSISFAVGRRAGSSDRRLLSRLAPAFVRVGNFNRMMLPCADLACEGSRSERALGRRLKPGHISSVGIPQSSNTYHLVKKAKGRVHVLSSLIQGWRPDSPYSIDPLRSCLVVAAIS